MSGAYRLTVERLSVSIPVASASSDSQSRSRNMESHYMDYQQPNRRYCPYTVQPRSGASNRERSRMQMLNEAFDALRQVVPRSNLSEHQRLSKIATLRLAITYIKALDTLLQTQPKLDLLPQQPHPECNNVFYPANHHLTSHNQ